jgi:hypothetical protein
MARKNLTEANAVELQKREKKYEEWDAKVPGVRLSAN